MNVLQNFYLYVRHVRKVLQKGKNQLTAQLFIFVRRFLN